MGQRRTVGCALLLQLGLALLEQLLVLLHRVHQGLVRPCGLLQCGLPACNVLQEM